MDEVTDGCSLPHVPMKMWMMSHLPLEIACELIANTLQTTGIEVIQRARGIIV